MADTFTNWQEAWEAQAQSASNAFTHFSDDDLLTYIKNGQSDPFFVVWTEVGSRKKPEIFADAVRAVVDNPHRSNLDRYHAEHALTMMPQK